MKIKILSLFLLIFPILLNAQNTEIEWGKEYKVPKRNEQRPFIGISSNHYFLNYKKRKGNTLMVYNFDHELVQKIPLGRNQDNKRIVAESIIKTKEGHFLITSANYKKEKVEFVYASAIEEDGNVNLTTNHFFAYSISHHQKYIGLPFGMYSSNKDNYGFAISADSTKLLFTRVAGKTQALRIGGKDKYQLFVFDQFFGKIWEKTIRLPEIDNKINIDQFLISNNGNVSLIVSKIIKEGRKKYWIPKYDLCVLRVNERGIFAELNLGVPNSYPIVATGFCDENESLYIAGVYTNARGPKEEVGANGTFMMKFDKTSNLLFSKKHPFDITTKEAIAPSRMKRAGKSFFNFDIDLLLVDFKNQNFSFVAENRYISNVDQYSSDDILIPNFSFDGDINWVYHYPKRFQHDFLYTVPSMIFMKENKIFLFHHCFKSKEERKALGHEIGYRYSYYTDLVAVNLSGELESKKTLFNFKGFVRRPINPKLCRALNDGRILIYAHHGDKFKFGICKIPEYE